ncbi:MAG: T9SS type A sorting domain-containing protein [Bacteroidota bacterium]
MKQLTIVFRTIFLIPLCIMAGGLQAQTFINVTPVPIAPSEHDVRYSALAIGDYNNNGQMDMYLSGYNLHYDRYVAAVGSFTGGIFLPDSLASSQLVPLIHGNAEWGDCNNDGFLDLLSTGEDSMGIYHTIVYLNDGNGSLIPNGDSLFGVSFGEARFGDRDNDGDLDLVVTGKRPTPINTWMYGSLKYYQNDGTGHFRPIREQVLNPSYNGSISWIDFNQDDYSDIISTGDFATGFQTEFISRLSHRGTMESTHLSMGFQGAALINSTFSWYDYDNDQDLDHLATGLEYLQGDTSIRAGLYVMDSLNSFEHPEYTPNPFNFNIMGGDAQWGDINDDGTADCFAFGKAENGQLLAKILFNVDTVLIDSANAGPITGVDSGSVVWVDFNGDQRLDIIATGNDANGVPYMSMYQNNLTNPLQSPNHPQGLSHLIDSNINVQLSWNLNPGDALGLSHNVRIGTTPGGTDILDPMADPNTGQRRIYRLGNAGINHSLIIAGLDTGTYYWSVQTIGADYEGSSFAPEQSFSYQPSYVVFPGDANFDQLVDMQDFLTLGLAFSTYGPMRPGATLNWVSQTAIPWQDSIIGIDRMHMDTDGSGLIGLGDSLAIWQNYGLTHTASKTAASGLPISVEGFPANLNPSDTLELDIVLGTIDTNAIDIYGLNFSIHYDTSLVEPSSVAFVPDSSWLGKKNDDMMTLYKDLFEDGQVDIGLVRTDQMNRTGYGRIGSVVIVMDDDISKREIPFVLTVEQTYAIDNTNTEIPTIGRGGSTAVLVDSTNSTAIADWLKADVAIYPNPVSPTDMLHVQSGESNLLRLRLMDQRGRMLYSFDLAVAEHEHDMKIPNPVPGVYFLEITTDQGSFWERILIR